MIYLIVLNVLYVLNMPKDASLARWASFFSKEGKYVQISPSIMACYFILEMSPKYPEIATTMELQEEEKKSKRPLASFVFTKISLYVE